jgi:hypothetical protein
MSVKPYNNFDCGGINFRQDINQWCAVLNTEMKLIHEPTYALNKIKLNTGIKLPHILVPGYRHQGST